MEATIEAYSNKSMTYNWTLIKDKKPPLNTKVLFSDGHGDMLFGEYQNREYDGEVVVHTDIYGDQGWMNLHDFVKWTIIE